MNTILIYIPNHFSCMFRSKKLSSSSSSGLCMEIIYLTFTPLNAQWHPIYHLLSLLGAHQILHVSRIRVKKVHAVIYNWLWDLKICSILVLGSYSTTKKMPLLSQIIYSCKTLYMFRTVFPSINRSSKLRIQQRYKSNRCCYLLL